MYCACAVSTNDVLCSNNVKLSAVVAYYWVGSCCVALLKAAVLWQNVVPLGGSAGAVMARLAGAGVVTVAGTGTLGRQSFL